ncbi:MAG: ABC transporter ATP-binding protein, partial [Bacillota bacterium]
MKLLELMQVSISFGGLKAVSDVNLHINSGEVVGLIGPNGAGKTTMFNLVTGVYRPTEGNIVLNGKSIAGKKPNRITEAGIARTFQNIRLFGSLSVLDNVKIAYHNHTKHNLLQSVLATPGHFRGEAEMTAKALELLEIFGLGKRKDEVAKNLPYGEQRRLEIARALAAQPKLLLLDEPAAGMNPQENKELLKLIHWVRERFD